jgi:hypothetical protein
MSRPLGFAETSDPNRTTISDPFGWFSQTGSGTTPVFSTTVTATAPGSGITGWLSQNSTAVVIVAGALFLLALMGGRRR